MEMVLEILKDLFWPIKGIIYFEEQVLQWGLAFLIVYSKDIMPIIITIFGIGLMLYSANIRRYMHDTGRHVRHFGIAILAGLFNILFAWVFLIMGALRGTITGIERVTNYTFESHGGHLHQRRERNYPSLHYRLGRWIYRIFFVFVFRFIPNVAVRMVISRICALIVILWGVWNIPYSLTH